MKARVYTDAERELFARYVAARADHRPAGCNSGPGCWVAEGPPGFSKRRYGFCVGCGCSILDQGPANNPTGKNGRTMSGHGIAPVRGRSTEAVDIGKAGVVASSGPAGVSAPR